MTRSSDRDRLAAGMRAVLGLPAMGAEEDRQQMIRLHEQYVLDAREAARLMRELATGPTAGTEDSKAEHLRRASHAVSVNQLDQSAARQLAYLRVLTGDDDGAWRARLQRLAIPHEEMQS